jgi:hypothetical protein
MFDFIPTVALYTFMGITSGHTLVESLTGSYPIHDRLDDFTTICQQKCGERICV